MPDGADVLAAAARLSGRVHRTPVFTSSTLDRLSGARLFFKAENFQRSGAFKFRGACYAVGLLPEDVARQGVVTHSSGNHAAALALAAAERGIPAHIVMPENASAAKLRSVAAYGGRITLCAPTLAAREESAARILRETGGVLVHPYDDPAIIAGQGTVAVEFLEDVPGLDVIVAPVSGGGLLGGIALGVAAVDSRVEVFGAEPERADDAFQSLREGRLVPAGASDTIADGLRAGLSERTFAVIRPHVKGIIRVGEDEIVAAMRLVWERLKLVVEASAAVPLAAVLREPARFRGRQVGVVLSGGNIDLERLPW